MNQDKFSMLDEPIEETKDRDLILKAKLDKLQRIYRWTESKRIGFYSKIQLHLDKQQHIINNLLKEKNELELNLNKATGKIFFRENEKWSIEFAELLENQDELKCLIENEIQKIKEIEEQIRQIDKQIHHYRLQLLNLNKNKLPEISNYKKLWIVENKLYQTTVKHNLMVNNNKILRDYLNHLLKLRSRFNYLFTHYNEILNKRKNKIQNLCRDATMTYEQREEIRNHLQTLKESSRLEYNQNSQKIKEFMRLLKFQNDLTNFMTQKQKQRTDVKELMDKKERGEKKPEELLQYYNKAFEQIKAVTHDNDLNNIAKHFVQSEEENFKLYKYVNELRDQSERILEKIDSTKKKVEDLYRINERLQQQQNITIENLEISLQNLSEKTDKTEIKLKLCKENLDQSKQDLVHLFYNSGCNNQSLINLLGGSDGVNNNNILKYLSVLENWISELILYYQYLQIKEPDSSISRVLDRKSPKFRHSTSSLSITTVTPTIINPAIKDIDTSFSPNFDIPTLQHENLNYYQEVLLTLSNIPTKQELKKVSCELIKKKFNGSVQNIDDVQD